MNSVNEQISEKLSPIVNNLLWIGALPLKNNQIFNNHLSLKIGNEAFRNSFGLFQQIMSKGKEKIKAADLRDLSKEIVVLQFTLPLAMFYFNPKDKTLITGEFPNWALYEFILACIINNPSNYNLTDLIANLRKINFKDKWINNLIQLHTIGNLYKPYFNIFEIYSDCINLEEEKLDVDLYQNKIINMLLSVQKSREYIPESENLQFLTFQKMDIYDKELEGLILHSSWKRLNRIFELEISIEDKTNWNKKPTRKELTKLLEEGKLDKLIPLLPQFETISNEARLISAQYNYFVSEMIKGTISEEHKDLKRNRLADNILKLIKRI